MVYIYILFDNLISKPIYVGATKTPDARFLNHKSKTLAEYVNKASVTMEILEEVAEREASEREIFWFTKYKDAGFPLIQNWCGKYPVYNRTANLTDGRKTTQLNKRALEILSNDEDLQIAIGKVFHPVRKIRTVKRWIAANDKRLTTLDALTLIKAKNGLTDEEILTNDKEFAKAV